MQARDARAQAAGGTGGRLNFSWPSYGYGSLRTSAETKEETTPTIRVEEKKKKISRMRKIAGKLAKIFVRQKE